MQFVIAQSRRILRAMLLATGQTTVYVAGDNGTFPVGVAKRYSILTTGQYAGTTNIVLNGKTDVHSNNCVLDLNTGLMWSRYVSASVGPTSNGSLNWTTNASGEGIFPYKDAANSVDLAGHIDWRIPNVFELMSLLDEQAPFAMPDSTAFPSFPAAICWSSTSEPDSTASGLRVNFVAGVVQAADKVLTRHIVILVRGTV